jgi:RND superfamily putative drug exporter
MVSRFREELAAGREPHRAAALTRRTAGRTAAVAGATLFFSIFLSAFFQPGTLLVSLAAALAVVTALAVATAWVALPALLTLLGPRINLGRIGRRRPADRSAVAAAASRVLRRPALAAALITAPLLLLSVPALAFNTGSPGVDELSPESSARRNAETISAVVGAGWQAPLTLTVAADRGPITAAPRTALLAATQRRIEALPGVEAVIGPGAVVNAARPLRSLAHRLGPRSRTSELATLGPRLNRASTAVGALRGGIGEAAAGAGLLADGSGRAAQGAALISDALVDAAGGAERAQGALRKLASGSRRLAAGQRVAAATAYNLSRGLGTLEPSLRRQGLPRARRIVARLEASGSTDRAVAVAAHEASVLASVLAANREELQRLRSLGDSLEYGLHRLYAGETRLRDATDRLAPAADRLGGGLRALGGGAETLSGGLGQLRGGAEALSGGLAEGSRRAHPLQRALRRAGDRVATTTVPLRRQLDRLHRVSPRIFDSGYLTLAAAEGARPLPRSLAAEVINVPRGGTAARYLVIPTAGFNTRGSRRLDSRLRMIGERLDRRSALAAAVGGGAAVLNDYGTETKQRLPFVVGAIILITLLMLLVLLRAPLLATLAVVLNLLSVGAAIGVVTLACEIPAGYPLGGHPYIDTVGGAAIFGVTFGLSIDYAVFLLARMRERHAAGGDNATAIRFGLERTAGVITGAAAIMAAVFVTFAAAPVATVSQMGLGLTVSILLDATVVRIVLLPALMLLIGERVWRTPGWLDRLLPPPGRSVAASEAVG